MLKSMLDRALATLTLEQLQAEQSTCLQAYLALSKGARTASVTAPDGRRVDYARSELPALEKLLAAIDRAIATKTGDTAAQAATRRRPLHPIY
jgi:hypothetical protein